MAAVTARTHETASSVSRCTYHVFLSFRGEDTRKNFTDHLYAALEDAGIHTFRDDDEIERGENIEAELEKAIKESKVAVIVFSKDYASSRWCLDELVMIMERRKAVGLMVLPVFYDVEPTQVRKQSRSYAKAFARHAKRFKSEMQRLEHWRAALKEAADLGGLPLQNRHESQFIQDIVKEVEIKLSSRRILNVAPHLVGIESRTKEINLWLQESFHDVVIATMYGIGGIGKTTLAKTVYNMNFDRFQGRSFLANVRDTMEERNGLVRLQSQLLSDLRRKKHEVYNADQGIIEIKDALSCKKVLIVLDDVDELDHLDAIIGMQEWLLPGSKVLITTRHERLLKADEVCKKFNVKELDDHESLQLFCWNAFGQGHPLESHRDCSRKVVDQCGGLPLALRVLGSSLSGKSITVWDSALKKLEAIPDSKVQKILRISYDSLQDDHDKNLFLDLACFFVGKDRDYAVGILDGCDYYTANGIQNLIDRCLLTVKKKKLAMHQLVRDMGREIVRQESTDEPGKRSRLWHHKDAFRVLKEKIGTEAIKGLSCDLLKLMEDKHEKTAASANNAKRQYHEQSLDKSTIGNCLKRRRLNFFSWQPISSVSENSFPMTNNQDLETRTFTKMPNLNLLQLNYVKLKGNYEDFPRNLIWLCWHGFCLDSIPNKISLEKLVTLDLRYGSLKCVWKGLKFLPQLKFLNLSHCHSLTRSPDFLGLPNLERLILKDCINLVKVDESIGDLKQLAFLNLKNCRNIIKLPRKFGMLKSLEELNLSGCVKLDELPEDLREMESLKLLHADGISINQLLAATRDTKILNLLSPSLWHSTFWSWLLRRRRPYSTGFLSAFLPGSLTGLCLQDCNLSDDDILNNLSSLPCLQVLYLSGNPFRRLPESITKSTMLQFLTIDRCTEIQSIPELPMSLTSLEVNDCTSLERITNLPSSSRLLDLDVYGCGKLVEVQGLFKLVPIENIDMRAFQNFGLSNLESLQSIEVDLFSVITLAKKKTFLQVLIECGVTSIFLPGSDMPTCFSQQSTGSSISFHIPPTNGLKIQGLSLCISYTLRPHPEYTSFYPHHAQIHNTTKGMRWTYTPIFYAIPGTKEKDMLWLSHWQFGNDELEAGDYVDISVIMPPGFESKTCGICLVYEPQDKSSEARVLSSYPWYQTLTLSQAEPNAYFRCHHSLATLHLKIITSPVELLENEYIFEGNPQQRLKECIICEQTEREI